jgi:hypothetical protein
MPRSREEIRQSRRQARETYGELFDATAALLYRHDPMGIGFDNPNTDEYAPQAETILPRLSKCRSSGEVLPLVHEEFCRWFGIATAGPRERYAQIASDLWHLCHENSRKPNRS